MTKSGGKTMRKVLLHICWALEDIMDFITHHHANWFYPSNRFEPNEEEYIDEGI